MSAKQLDQIVRELQRILARLPYRAKLALGGVAFLCFWFLLLDTPPLEPERPRRRTFKPTPAPSLPGGDWRSFKQIFAFGDSWSTTHFDASGVQPNEGNPYGNPDIPKNGSTSPPNWLHFLTSTHNASFIRTYIIAEGAATIDRAVVPPHEFLNWTKTFKEQVDQVFLPTYASPSSLTKWDPQETLFAIWFGVVDVALLVDRKDTHDDINVHNIDAYFKIIDKLYEHGARHILILTIPPMYISPYAREPGHDPTLERTLITDFNDRVYAARKELVAKHPQLTAYVFDVHGLLTEAISSPESIVGTEHLRNTTEPCPKYNPDAYKEPHPWDWYEPECGVPLDQYFWANPLHPTHAAHNATAAAIVQGCMGAARSGYCS